MQTGVSTEALTAHEDARPTSVVGVRQAVCDASRDVVGYEVLTGDPDAPPASARYCARALWRPSPTSTSTSSRRITPLT